MVKTCLRSILATPDVPMERKKDAFYFFYQPLVPTGRFFFIPS
jgi:hypothetical protein